MCSDLKGKLIPQLKETDVNAYRLLCALCDHEHMGLMEKVSLWEAERKARKMFRGKGIHSQGTNNSTTPINNMAIFSSLLKTLRSLVGLNFLSDKMRIK